MAARLNRPGDFVLTKPPGGKMQQSNPANVELLPPSSFEAKPPSADAWKELAHATNEILTLKQENARLSDASLLGCVTRYTTPDVGQKCAENQLCESSGIQLIETQPAEELHTESAEIRAQVNVHHLDTPGSRSGHISPGITTHYEEIINRQAADIAALRKQLTDVENNHQRELVKLESEALLGSARSEQQMATLGAQLTRLQESHQQEMDSVCEKHNSLLTDAKSKVSDLRSELEHVKKSRTQEVSKLEDLVQDLEGQVSSLQSEKQKTLSEKETLLGKQQSTITQLKQYITESEDTYKSTDVWRRDVENLKHKLQKHEKERENLESTVQLLNVRLSSQNKILSVHEQELATEKEDFTPKTKQNLLTRWREKVYALMVQAKTSEIVHAEEERRWQQQINELEKSVASAENQCSVLQHTIEDKEAQIKIEQNKVKNLEEELVQVEQLAMTLDEKNQEDRKTAQMLAQFAHNVYNKYLESEALLETLQSTLRQYGQRITFAAGRVEMVQGQFARKQARLRVELDEALLEKPTRDHDMQHSAKSDGEREPPNPRDCELIVQLQSELEKVTAERDQLSIQLREDAVFLDSKIGAAKAQYADEVEELKMRLAELHEELDAKTQRCEELCGVEARLRGGLEEAEDRIQQLENDCAQKQQELEKAVEKERNVCNTEMMEQVAQMEQQVNEARREHAKAVVSSSQLERQLSRHKEKTATDMRKMEEHYTCLISNLEEKLRTAEKDRNILMATLRQEGLIGKYKSQRPAPAIGEEDTEEPMRGTDTSVRTAYSEEPMRTADTSAVQMTTKPDEPLHNVIDDLRSLTAAVLDGNGDGDADDDDSSDDNS